MLSKQVKIHVVHFIWLNEQQTLFCVLIATDSNPFKLVVLKRN
jgi:hypothetical protein